MGKHRDVNRGAQTRDALSLVQQNFVYVQNSYCTISLHKNAYQFTCTEQKAPDMRGSHFPRKLCTLAQNLLHVNLLSPKIWRWLLKVWKNLELLNTSTEKPVQIHLGQSKQKYKSCHLVLMKLGPGFLSQSHLRPGHQYQFTLALS